MVDLDDGAGLAQARLVRDLLHRQDRPDRDVERVADLHHIEFGPLHGPIFDGTEHLVEPGQPRLRRRVAGVVLPFGPLDQVADLRPRRRLGDEIGVGVVVGLPALAFEDAAGLSAARIVGRARHRVLERDVLAVLRVLGERAGIEALLVAQLDPAEIDHPVLHRREDALAAARALALEQRGDDAEREVKPGAAVADLGAGDHRHVVAEPGGGRRAAGALGDVLVDLAVLVGAGAEALDRGHDHARVQLPHPVPAEPHAVERAGREVLDQHVAGLHQALKHLLAGLVLGVELDRALVVVEHGEIEAVGARLVDQLAARRIAGAGPFHLDHVGPEPGQQLGAGRPRLDMGEVEYLDALERFHRSALPDHLYIVWALVPGAYSLGSTQTLTTAHLPVLAIASRARRSAGWISEAARTSSP